MKEVKITKAELVRIAHDEVPFAGGLGLLVDTLEAGRVVVRVPYQGGFVRPGGTIAGPVMMAAADFAMYAVVLSLIGPVKLAVTTNLNINFLRRPPPGDLLADARIIKLGRRLAVGEVSVYAEGAEGDLVAHVTSTYSIPPRG